jgi:hypothetical protein
MLTKILLWQISIAVGTNYLINMACTRVQQRDIIELYIPVNSDLVSIGWDVTHENSLSISSTRYNTDIFVKHQITADK